MTAAMTAEQCLARAKAFTEAASLLSSDWSHDDTEREQGVIVAQSMRLSAAHWEKQAAGRQRSKA